MVAVVAVADNLLILKILTLQPILFSGQDIYSFRCHTGSYPPPQLSRSERQKIACAIFISGQEVNSPAIGFNINQL